MGVFPIFTICNPLTGSRDGSVSQLARNGTRYMPYCGLVTGNHAENLLHGGLS